MNLGPAHLHLMLNHYAIFAALFGAALLLADVRAHARALRLAAYAIVISGAIMVIPTYITGVLAEDAIEGQAGVTEAYVEPHEDVGRIMLFITLLAGAASLVAVIRDRPEADRAGAIRAAVIVLAIGAFAAGGYTALLGGEIHHPEIRP